MSPVSDPSGMYNLKLLVSSSSPTRVLISVASLSLTKVLVSLYVKMARTTRIAMKESQNILPAITCALLFLIFTVLTVLFLAVEVGVLFSLWGAFFTAVVFFFCFFILK